MTPSTRSIAAAVILTALCSPAVSAQESDQWLNARDYGASGSKFQSAAKTTAGSKRITAADPGDFQVGQGVMVSRCNVRYTHQSLWGPHDRFAASRPVKDEIELRGYDGAAGSWVNYVLDVPPGEPLKFRWTDDLGRTWSPLVAITFDWQPLSGGTEVRFREFAWKDGYSVAIAARDQLLTTIEKIEGKVITLRDEANRSADDAVLRHNDTQALQAAVNAAIQAKKNLRVPVGHYSLAGPVVVKNPGAIVIEGDNAVATVLDISEGEGACLRLDGGTEATLRNFSMLGHMGFDQRDQAGAMRTLGGTAVWGFYFKKCCAVHISTTERVLVENCHARRMSMECFYSQGPSRSGAKEPKAYTKAITYLRCSVEDCARNAFNNNDGAENTRVLYCRIRDVGGCSWEGASRFVHFVGNYVRNAGTVAMGNVGSRVAHIEELGRAQHIVADNVFESNVPYGARMICAAAGATQIVIRNNIFVNFNSSAISIRSETTTRHLPAGNVIITGNIFDMTAVGDEPKARTAVDVSASDVTVGDNQIYNRTGCDPLLTGIRLRDGAMNLNVHDNLLRHCGVGITAGRLEGLVGEVIDPLTFCRKAVPLTPPLERRDSHRYRGWNVAWIEKGEPLATSVIQEFDPESCRFVLREPREMKTGDRFELFPPCGANWNLHDNTLTGCAEPVALECYGSESSQLKGNLISRGEATGVRQAVRLAGRFRLEGNLLSGFDEPDSAALGLYPDRFGKPLANIFCANTFQRCTQAVAESQPGLWQAAHRGGNLFVDCPQPTDP